MSELNSEDIAEVIESDVYEENVEMEDAPGTVYDNEEGEGYDDDDKVEIDMSNNSSGYFDKHTDSVFLTVSHPTKPIVFSGGADNMAYVWTTEGQPEPIAKLEGHTESVTTGGFLDEGNFLVTGDMNGMLRVWSQSTNWKCVFDYELNSEITTIAIHPTLPLFAAGTIEGSIWVFDINRDDPSHVVVENVNTITQFQNPVTALLFTKGNDESPNVIASSEDCTIRLINVYTGQKGYVVNTDHPVLQLEFSPSFMTVAASTIDGHLILVKVADGKVLKDIDVFESAEGDDLDRSVEGLAWGDKNLVATGTVDGTVKVWDVLTWRVRLAINIGDSITMLKFIKGTHMLVIAGNNGVLSVLDTLNNKLVWDCVGHNEGVLCFAIQLDGKRLISAGDDDVCLVFNKPEDE